MTDLIYDPQDAETLRNPHGIFKRLREEDPVHWSEPMSGWVLTGYDDACEILTDPMSFSAERLGTVRKHLPAPVQDTAAEILRWLNHWMVFRDPPDHTRLRRHMATILNLPVFESLRESISGIAHMLLDDIPKGETFDFTSRFAIQMPGMVIMDLFGIDRSRLLEVKGWSDDMMLFIGSARGVPDKYERARRGAHNMASLFLQQIEERRDHDTGDILSQLVRSEIDGQSMTDDEIIGSLMMVLNGGHETTANLLNNGLMALINNPDQAEYLRGGGDIVTATEEFLRYDSPILSIGRVVTEDLELGGKQLSMGERVFAMLLGANRDPDVFDDPDKFDVTRNPNPHMAFGKGAHFCLGTPLARIEGQIALGEILQRFGKMTIEEDMGQVPWINSMVTRGPTRLPVKFT